MNKHNRKLPFYAKLAYTLVAIIALVYIAILSKPLLAPLVFGFLFAILLYPVSRYLENKINLPRGLSSFLSILLFLSFFSLLFCLFVFCLYCSGFWALDLFRFFVGFSIAILIGVPTGFLLGRSSLLHTAIEPLFQLIRPISPIAWSPFVVLWFGIGSLPAMAIIFIAAK